MEGQIMRQRGSIDWRLALMIATTTVTVMIVAFLDPIAQDPAYHLFADTRVFANIANFQNVASNFPFLITGAAGLWLVSHSKASQVLKAKTAWLFFFAGIALTAFGSGYYHLAPTNEALVWDRLPMTIGFMSLVAIVVAEYFSAALGRKLLLPLLVVGAASVWYWSYTESLGRGDLRPYVIVQFLPMLLIPMIITVYASRSDLSRYLWWMIGFYVASKLAEFYDTNLYDAGQIVSGHALKHLIASLAPASLLVALLRRHKEYE
jgi:hypothetical protein